MANEAARTRPEARRAGYRAEPHASLHPWFIVLMLFFVVVTGITLGALNAWTRIETLLTPLNVALLALASYRLGRIISLDEVTEPLRKPFFEVREVDGEREEIPVPYGFRGAIAKLLSCPDCTGYWVAAALVYANLLWPGPAWVVTLVFAVNGLGHLFNAVVMFLARKREE